MGKKSIILFVILGLILGVVLSQLYNNVIIGDEKNKIDFQSQCYTNLQPSMFFLKSDVRLDPVLYIQNKGYIINELSSTGSMRPTIGDDSLVISTQNFTKEDLKIGDIIIYKREDGQIFVHRIVGKTNENYDDRVWVVKDAYLVKGDNNNGYDSTPIKFEQIIGKVVGVLY